MVGFLRGACVTLLPPLMLFAAFFAFAFLQNGRAVSGDTKCEVDRLWVQPGGTFKYTLSAKVDPIPGYVPQTTDMLFVVDVSGSMADYVNGLERSIRPTSRLVREDGANRFAIVNFNTDWSDPEKNSLAVGWTSSREDLLLGARNLTISGGTSSQAAADAIQTMITRSKAAPNTNRKVVVLLSDLGFGGGLSSLTASLSNVASQGGVVYVLYPIEHSRASLNEILALSSQYPSQIITLEMQNVSRLQRRLGNDILAVENSVLHSGIIPVHPKAFSLNDESALAPDWQSLGDENGLQTNFSPIPPSVLLEAPLIANKTGFWIVGDEPGQISPVGQPLKVNDLCAARPALLVAPLWLLLLFFLPFLIWLISQIASLFSRKPKNEVFAKRRVRKHKQDLGALNLQRGQVEFPNTVPTLLVGIGDTGVDVVQTLSFATYPPAVDNIKGIALARPGTKDHERSFGEGGSILQSPIDLSKVEDEISGDGNENLPNWFDRNRYANASRDSLDVTAAGASDRMLQRLYSHKWLGSGLQSHLKTAYQDLVEKDDRGHGQVIFVLSMDDDFATASLLDMAKGLNNTGEAMDMFAIVVRDPAETDLAKQDVFLNEVKSGLLSGYNVPAEMSLDDQYILNEIFVIERDQRQSAKEQVMGLTDLLRHREASAKFLMWRDALELEENDLACVNGRTVSVSSLAMIQAAQKEISRRWITHYLLGDVKSTDHGMWSCTTNRTQNDAGVRALFEANQRFMSNELGNAILESVRTGKSEALEAYIKDPVSDVSIAGQDIVTVSQSIIDLIGKGTSEVWTLGDVKSGIGSIEQLLEGVSSSFTDSLDVELIEFLSAAVKDVRQILEAEIEQLCTFLSETDKSLSSLLESSSLELTDVQSFVDVVERRVNNGDELDAFHGRIKLAIEEHYADGKQMRCLYRISIDKPETFTRRDAFISSLETYSYEILKQTGVDTFWRSAMMQDREQAAIKLRDELSIEGVTGESIFLHPPISNRGDKDCYDVVKKTLPSLTGSIDSPRYYAGLSNSAFQNLSISKKAFNLEKSIEDASSTISLAERNSEKVRRALETAYQKQIPVLPARVRALLHDISALSHFAQAYATGHIKRKRKVSGNVWMFKTTPISSVGGNVVDATKGYLLGFGKFDGKRPALPKSLSSQPAFKALVEETEAWMGGYTLGTEDDLVKLVLRAILEEQI